MMEKRTNNVDTKAEKRMDQIINAAIEVFLKKGYEGATTKEIAKKAKVSEGTIFRYFKTKKDILIAILNRMAEQVFLEFEKEMHDNGNDNERETVKKLLKKYYRFIVNNSDLLKILFFEVQFHKDLKKEFNENVLSKILEKSSDIIKEAGYEGKTNSDIVVNVLCGLFFGLIIVDNINKSISDSNVVNGEVIDEIVDIILNGIKRDA